MALSLAHSLNVGLLMVVVAVGSFTQPLCSVGARSLFPAIVPRHLWDRSNALDSSTFVVAQVLGPIVAGLGVALVGVRWALLVPVALYVISAAALVGVHATAVDRRRLEPVERRSRSIVKCSRTR